MSDWNKYDIPDKIINILKNNNSGHHFGNEYMSAYQIAIEFDKSYPSVVATLGYHVGGKGVGTSSSLAKYLAKELSAHIKAGTITDIEGAYLNGDYLNTMLFKGTNTVESSVDRVSIFRIKNNIDAD